ncbi:winged helix-turn-helix domain-containing protein [Winogradskya consettensis]|uniref:Transcriptional regulator n=1 Tax=Winogradskya consettensis TaxID=113560 RepID=A0A919VRQ2_9ACTN|nr:winged helix-turn-helix domain-containing protein [Actinoplanes consettensis]GIM73961.1 transcriptional regulator [Actinoplanes consettensis]
MTESRALSRFAALLADETRATICLALLDGRAWTAGELATHAGVAPATATGHLHKLVAGGILTEQRQGRHRYVRLSGAPIAQLIEDLAGHVPAPPTPARGLRAVTASAALARGRTCYDHLAGRLGVAITDAMDHKGLLSRDPGFTLTDPGRAWLTALTNPAAPTTLTNPPTPGPTGPTGPGAPTRSRRPLARGCLDWTERREHLAGIAGATLCSHALTSGWLTRIGSSRAVRVTPAGTTALTDLLGPHPAWTGT